MNTKRMLALAAFIEAEPRKFNITRWFTDLTTDNNWWPSADHKPDCGTAGCIAGNAVRLFARPRDYDALHDRYDMTVVAGKLLGLTSHQANDLFIYHWPSNSFGGIKPVSAQKAAAYIRTMAGRRTTKPATVR